MAPKKENKQVAPSLSKGLMPSINEDERVAIQHGTVGTDIFSGYIDVDYNAKWKDWQTRIETVEEMMWGDATVEAILMALKSPILSLKFFVEPCDDSDEEKEIADFVEDNLFHEIKDGFDWFLEQSLTMYEYGCSIFEKVYKLKNGKIMLHNLAFREQKSIEKWTIDGAAWRDGHPAGITQQINSSDDVVGTSIKEIPWENILLFSHKRKGNNFEGTSALRSSYIHWYMKNLLYKIGGVAADRFGVGIPYIKFKSSASKKDIDKYEELVKNIKSNEKGYAVFNESVVEFDILTPKGNSEKGMMKDMIDHHDRKIYDSILAGFLNLSSGDGGSNALSKDQSSFFLRGLQRNVNYICSVINNHLIKELVYFNYGKRDRYPTLKASDVGQISMDEYVNSIKAAKEGGLLNWTSRDEDKVREQIKMPSISKEERDEMEKEKEEFKKNLLPKNDDKKEQSELYAVDKLDEVFASYHASVNMSASELEAWSKTEASKKASLDRSPIQRNLRLLKKKKSEWTSKDVSDANKTVAFIARMSKMPKGESISKDIPYSKRDISLRNWAYNPDKKQNSEQHYYSTRPKEREYQFVKNISDFENYLASEYSQYERIVVDAESKLQQGISLIYEASEVELIDGQKVFSFSKKNREMQKKALAFVDKVQAQLTNKLIDSPMQDRLFTKTKSMAVRAMQQNKKMLADEIRVEESQFESFISGHVSNLKGVLYNEPRRISESIILNYGSQVRVDLAVTQANGIQFNRNVLKLSTVTHARGAYNAIQYNASIDQGFTLFKPVVPKKELKNINPSGMTASVLFMILSAAEINKRINKKTDGNNTDALTGMNLHHNAFVYYYPIASQDLEEEKEIAKKQREDFGNLQE